MIATYSVRRVGPDLNQARISTIEKTCIQFPKAAMLIITVGTCLIPESYIRCVAMQGIADCIQCVAAGMCCLCVTGPILVSTILWKMCYHPDQ